MGVSGQWAGGLVTWMSLVAFLVLGLVAAKGLLRQYVLQVLPDSQGMLVRCSDRC